MKTIIVASKLDPAGMNIINSLKELNSNIPIYIVDKEIINAENIDKELNSDFIVFASKHQSEKKEKALTVHTIGNFKKAEYGGLDKTLSPSSALLTKHFFQTLKKNNNLDYKLTMEATHHGPFIETPSLFIEIGSTKTEWNDKKAGKIIAETIIESIKTFKKSNKKIAIALGGPHYCPNFNEIQLQNKYAISFIVPKYSLPLDKSLIKQLKEKTIEPLKYAIVDWKGFNNSKERDETVKLIEELNIEIIKTRDARTN